MLLCLAEELRMLGLEPVIASIGAIGEPEKPLEAEAGRRGIDIHPFRMRPGPNYPGARRILHFARQRGIDVLHLHGYKGNILFGFLPRRLLELPRVTTLHGWTNTGRFNRMWFYEALDAVSLRFMDAVVLVNDRMREHPRIRGRHALRLRVIPNGIPAEPQSGTDVEERVAHFCSGKPVIGTIGRLSPEKGHAFLLEAVKLLEPVFPDLRVLIIGEGRLRASLARQAAAIGLESRLLITGYKDRAWEYFPRMDLFVLPSLTEGLPITLLEAMRAGCPIVASAVGGIPGALENGAAGALVAPGDPQGLAKAIHRVLESPDMGKRLGATARTIFRRRFSSRQMAERYADLYRSLTVPPCR